MKYLKGLGKIWKKIKNLILQDKINDIPEEIYKITKSENSSNPQEFKEWSISIKNKFLPKEYKKSYGYDVKVNPNKYIKYIKGGVLNVQRWKKKIDLKIDLKKY